MILYTVFIFYILIVVEVKTSSRVSTTCNSDIAPCYNRSTGFSEYYVENKTSDSSEIPVPRRVRGRSQKPRKRNHSRKFSNRRRSGRRKTHRHSTRVLSLKPAVVLLPPFETVADGSNGLDPFIINFVTRDNATTVPPAKESATEISATPRATTRKTPRTTTTLRPPNQWLLPPLLETPSNNVEPVRIDTAKNTRIEYGYATTVSYESASPAQNITSSANPFENLEREYNEILRITGGNVLEQVISNQTNTDQNSEDNSIVSVSSSENSVQEWSTTQTYNTSVIANDFGSFEDERSERQFVNSFDSSRNAVIVPNNTLLAPDVASLGMKIVTSKKGLEMVKEFTTTNRTRSRGDKRRYRNNRRNKDNNNLETAETGDFRNHAYDNQILSLEDTKDVPKEAYRALKGPHKPFQICSGNQGYVADPDSGCQVFYICLGRGAGEPMMCPNGTLFNQDFLVCDWWYNVECNG